VLEAQRPVFVERLVDDALELGRHLRGLMSRWTMPRACAASSASAIWAARSRSVSIGSACPSMRCFRVWPFEQLHHDEVLPVVIRCLPDVVNGADMRMVERGCGSRFALKTLHRLRVGGEVRREELQGHLSSEPRVFRAVDDAHAAAAKHVQHAIVGDDLADHWESF